MIFTSTYVSRWAHEQKAHGLHALCIESTDRRSYGGQQKDTLYDASGLLPLI